jgi:Flp pilus assembly protein TadD
MLGRAIQAFDQERYGDAFRDYSRALDLAPGDPRPHHGIGQVYLQTGRSELAEASFRKALGIKPDYVQSRTLISRALYNLGRHEESLSLLLALAAEKPDDPDVGWWLAKNYLRLARPEEASTWLRKYTEALPGSPWGFAFLGKALADRGEAEPAETAYRRSIVINPKLSTPWLWLGQLLLSGGKRAEAEGALATFRKLKEMEDEAYRAERAVLRRPDDFAGLLRLAKLRILLGMERKALLPLRRALELRPDDAEARALHEELRRSLGGAAPEAPGAAEPGAESR